MRGATVRIARLTPAEHDAGVIAISAGNHAAAVAVAAGLLGVHAVVVMPETAVRSKVEACRGYGAEVILAGCRHVRGVGGDGARSATSAA